MIESGLLIVMVGLAVAIVIVSKVAKTIRADLPGIKLEVGAVNRAVNNVASNEQPLIQQVREIRGLMVESHGVVTRELDNLHKRIDSIEGAILTPKPKPKPKPKPES